MMKKEPCLCRADHILINNYVDERGWVEHDPEEIYANTTSGCKRILLKKPKCDKKEQLPVLGISNQRETALVCGTVKPENLIYNADGVAVCERRRKSAKKLHRLTSRNRQKKWCVAHTGLQIISIFFSGKDWHGFFKMCRGHRKKQIKGNCAVGRLTAGWYTN